MRSSPAGAEVTGLDISALAIDRAKAAARERGLAVRFLVGDWGPRRVGERELREAFGRGGTAESIEPATFDLAPGSPVPQARAWAAAFRRTA